MEATVENFKEYTLRLEFSSRGGGIEIDLTPFGFKGQRMTAYQNYLGGGLLGRVCSYNTYHLVHKFIREEDANELDKIATELKKYFHSLTNPDTEWESRSFEENQRMPISGY